MNTQRNENVGKQTLSAGKVHSAFESKRSEGVVMVECFSFVRTERRRRQAASLLPRHSALSSKSCSQRSDNGRMHDEKLQVAIVRDRHVIR